MQFHRLRDLSLVFGTDPAAHITLQVCPAALVLRLWEDIRYRIRQANQTIGDEEQHLFESARLQIQEHLLVVEAGFRRVERIDYSDGREPHNPAFRATHSDRENH